MELPPSRDEVNFGAADFIGRGLLGACALLSQIRTDLAVLAPTLPISVDGGTAAERLPVGQLVRAEVLRLLGGDLFSIAIGGTKLAASSQLPLKVGDQFDVEVMAGVNGRVNLRVVPPATTQGVTQEEVARSGASSLGRSVTSANDDTPALRELGESTLAELVKPGGAVAKLVEARPELGPRIEKLLEEFARPPSPDRPALGAGIESVREEVARVTRALPTSEVMPAKIMSASAKLLEQVFGEEALADPKLLAAQLGERFAGLAKGFEALIARLVTNDKGSAAPTLLPTMRGSETLPTTNTSHASPSTVTSDLVGRAAEAKGMNALLEALQANKGLLAKPTISPSSAIAVAQETTSPPASARGAIPPTASRSDGPVANGSGTTTAVKGDGSAPRLESTPEAGKGNFPVAARTSFEGDVKGPLLEIRTQLQHIAASAPEALPQVTSALARADMVIEQITGQQIKNVDGLGQFASVEIPVDPKTGVEAARLQVFYREKNAGASLAEEERFTVALFLHLSRLGEVLATLTGIDGMVSIGFAVERPEVKEILSATLEELRSGLSAAGHEGAMITVRMLPKEAPTEEPIWEEFLAHAPTSAGARLDREA